MKTTYLLCALALTTNLLAEEEKPDFRTEGPVTPVQQPVETADKKAVAHPVDYGDDYKITREWEFSRRPWAVFVGDELPAALAEGAAHRKALKDAGYKILHVKKPSDLPSKFRAVAPKSGLLHLAWHDGTKKERIKPEDLTADKLKDFRKAVLKKSQKSNKRRIERLQRRLNHCLKIVQMDTVGEKLKIKRIEELREFAMREQIKGLPQVIDRLEVEVLDRNTTVTCRPTVVQMDELRVVPIAADGIAGSMGIELPGMSNRSVRTTVMAP